MKISIIIPTFNECQWLSETVLCLIDSLEFAKINNGCEIVFVDDGSTDGTRKTIKSLGQKYPKYPIRYVYQKNAGRLEARKRGLQASKYENTLLIDSRVHIDKESLDFAKREVAVGKLIWNAHVVIKRSTMLSMFWDVITRVAWHKYFKNPRPVSYGLQEFDLYPKGTTCFLAPKKLLQSAIEEYERTHRPGKTANDDTAILRLMIRKKVFNMSPQFRCYYHARTSLKKFAKHSYHRGQVFVDGFLPEANRYRPVLIVFYLAPILLSLIIMLFGRSSLAAIVGAGTGFVLLGYASLILYFKINIRDATNFLLVTPVFAVLYGGGLWAGLVQFIRHKMSA